MRALSVRTVLELYPGRWPGDKEGDGHCVGCVTGRATGEAYVEFKTAAIAEEAVQARNNQNLRHRYLE